MPGTSQPHDAHVQSPPQHPYFGNTGLTLIFHSLFQLYLVPTEKFCQNDISLHFFSPANLQLLVSNDLFGFALHWFMDPVMIISVV